MSGIFLNNPKVPKGPRFYLRVVALLLLFALQLGLVIVLYRKSVNRQELERNTTVAELVTTAAPTEPPPPQALSILEEDMRGLVDSYFGPLPRPVKNPPTLKSLYPVKGIYLGPGKNLQASLELAKHTEINSFVIDVKESWGLCYPSKVPLAQEMNAASGTMDFKKIVKKCHDAGVNVIARIVCFKDEVMPYKRPDLCLRTEDGDLLHYPLEGGLAFANPYDTRVWDYLLDIAKEVVEMGADEIQFDYVRFPTGLPQEKGVPAHQKIEEEIGKEYAINRFLERARIEIQENLGVPISADLFSIVMTSKLDGILIGQNWDTIGLTGIDNICPMIYPSHYANASQGSQGNGEGSFIGKDFFKAPDTEPYEVVSNAIIDGYKASSQAGYTRLRPWLQAFTASWLAPGYYIEYGPQEIRTQIDAVYDAYYTEWILWNAEFTYPKAAFLSKEEAEIQNAELQKEVEIKASERVSEQKVAEATTTRRFPIATGKSDE